VSACSYDNPSTMQREAWIDGRRIGGLSAHMIFSRNGLRMRRFVIPLELSLGPADDFRSGAVYGDINAIAPAERARMLARLEKGAGE
jgi:hypothetical protein